MTLRHLGRCALATPIMLCVLWGLSRVPWEVAVAAGTLLPAGAGLVALAQEGGVEERLPLRRAVRRALRVGVATLGVLGWCSCWGALAVPLGAVVALCLPPVQRQIRRWLARWAPTQPGRTEPAALTDDQLRREWRTTYDELVSAPVARRLTLVDRREDLLDEMERRDGAGFQHWLRTRPGAAEAPSD